MFCTAREISNILRKASFQNQTAVERRCNWRYNMDLTLRFDDNGTGHRDIVLHFAGQSWVCDSYYLALDRRHLADRCDAEKVRAVLCRLLEQWLAVVENESHTRTVFLPYDFSDQYTAWLRCQRDDGEVIVSRGWAEVEGWSFFPSAVGDYLSHLSDFHLDGPTVRVEIAELVGAIRASWIAVASGSC